MRKQVRSRPETFKNMPGYLKRRRRLGKTKEEKKDVYLVEGIRFILRDYGGMSVQGSLLFIATP